MSVNRKFLFQLNFTQRVYSELASSLLPDYAVKLAAELESASRLRAAQFLVTQRPWLGN